MISELRNRNLAGRACGVAATLLVSLWLGGGLLGLVNVAAATRNGRWGVWLNNGAVQMMYSETPAFVVGYFNTPASSWLTGISQDPAGFTAVPPDPNFVNRPLVRGEWRASTWVSMSWVPSTSGWGASGTVFIMPLWCLAVPFAVVSVESERRHRQRVKQERRGKCRKCGYDRTGLGFGVVCPECGKR